jgi:hypothetical protein
VINNSNHFIHNSQFKYSEWKETEPKVTAGEGKKLYAVGGHTSEDWNSIHSSLLAGGIECYDEKSHSSTRAVYYLTDAEAESLKTDARVRYVNLDCSQYLGTFAPDPNDLVDSISKTFRYSTPAKQYRDWGGLLTEDASDLNRASFQLYRCMQKDDPWVIDGNDNTVFTSRLEYYGDGSDVDVVVSDESCWFGHSEFRRNAPNSSNPTNYVGGNALDPNGTCDVLDLVLDAPYYIDPDWFNADGVLLVIGLQNSNRSEQYLLLLHTLEQHVMAVIAHFILMVDIMELHVQVLHMVELMVGHLILRSGLSILMERLELEQNNILILQKYFTQINQ